MTQLSFRGTAICKYKCVVKAVCAVLCCCMNESPDHPDFIPALQKPIAALQHVMDFKQTSIFNLFLIL